MYYTRTKDNINDRVTVEVYADHGSLVADRRFFNRSDGLFQVREISANYLEESILGSKKSRKPDVIRLMTKDGVRFRALPMWLRSYIVRDYIWNGDSCYESDEFRRIFL